MTPQHTPSDTLGPALPARETACRYANDAHIRGVVGRTLQQPYTYRRRPREEPDWHRLPGYAKVSRAEWHSAQWQRANCVKNLTQLRAVMGDLLEEAFYADADRDRRERATMSMLLPPYLLNTMVPAAVEPRDFDDAFRADPVRRYMLPVFSDRRSDWPSHPYATRDSLREADMWVVEGLTHRYPTKILAELVSTCPQYCGHCTRMDLVGQSTPQVTKRRFSPNGSSRTRAMLEYLRCTPGVRDIVVSGGDVANVPWPRLEAFVDAVLDIDSVRDVRLATKALVALPQHWLDGCVRTGLTRLAAKARRRGAQLSVHTHVNVAHSVTPLVGDAARAMLDAGIRDVRNQGVLLRGVNDSTEALLDLCFALQDEAGITPYYIYMCDMIPNSEHWRLALWEAQELQHSIMGVSAGIRDPPNRL